jgi:hypothetical protein
MATARQGAALTWFLRRSVSRRVRERMIASLSSSRGGIDDEGIHRLSPPSCTSSGLGSLAAKSKWP